MKFQSIKYRYVFAVITLIAAVLSTSPVAAQLFQATYLVTNAEDSGPGSLRDAILSANTSLGTDTIEIQVAGELLLASPLPVISDSVTITSNGYAFIIDGSSQFRIFEVPAGVRLELIQLELVSGTAGDGNGGAVWNAGTLEVQDCTFLANFSELGGAIYNEGVAHLGPGSEILSSNATQGAGIYNLGALSMEETSFSGNNAPLEGGAIYNLGSLTVLGGEFSSGLASDGAGIYSSGGNLTLDGSVFWDLETTTSGGAIYANGAVSLQNITLGENHATQGGALYLGSNAIATLIDSSFAQNQAESGGAIQNEGALTISNTSISGNHALGNGGGLFNTGELTLSSVILVQNIADGDGGGLYNSPTGTATLQAVTLQENEARAGGALVNGGELVSESSHFTANHADWGGALQNTGTLVLNSGQLNDNNSDSEGGGIYNTGTLTLNEVQITGNRTGFEGGGLVNQGEATILASRFESNYGGDDFGGAISNRSTATLHIEATDFIGNFVNNGGGAIFSSGSLLIEDSKFEGNGAKWGGAIHIWRAEGIQISGSSFSDNYAAHWGGAILNDGNLELENCTFTANQGEEFSGALHNNGNLVARHVTFSGNTVEHGPGGAVVTGGIATFEESTFDNNQAATNGGAISAVQQDSELNLRQVTFSLNEAEDGGAVYNEATLNLSATTFNENYARNRGNAIFNQGALEASGSFFDHNGSYSRHPQEGGAIYNAADASANFSSTTFTFNFAWYNGGAIASYGPLVVTGSDFTNNLALDQGGAIYQVGASASLQDTNFWGNESWNYAGTIASYNTDMEILRCLLAHSYSWYGGAIRSGGTLRIENSTIAHNMANEGPAIQNYATATLAYTTIFGNTLDSNISGGALENYASLTLSNSIVAGTTDGYNCTGSITRSGPNISDDYSCGRFTVTDPRLGPLQDNGGPTFTHALLWNSPAEDAASGACPLTDQRGVTRPQGLACDLGAFEATPFQVSIDIAPKSNANLVNLNSTGSISVAVLSVTGFDAPTVVERASLRFGATGTENPPLTFGRLSKLSCSAGDINGDGLADLVCKFAIPGANFTCSSQVGLLSGALQNGDLFTSQDLIRPYPCP